ncbi:hypothetical protein ACJ41O_011517 [Fusarium nematophilum]
MSASPGSNKPTLPANVCIFSPTKTSAVSALLGGRIFTRLVASAGTKPAQLAAIKTYPGVDESFYLSHGNVMLIFDGGGGEGDKQGDELEDVHHEHFRIICLALKEHDIGLDVAGCIHDATDILGAGFQLDKLNDGAALVIDLVEAEDSDDDEDSAA